MHYRFKPGKVQTIIMYSVRISCVIALLANINCEYSVHVSTTNACHLALWGYFDGKTVKSLLNDLSNPECMIRK